MTILSWMRMMPFFGVWVEALFILLKSFPQAEPENEYHLPPVSEVTLEALQGGHPFLRGHPIQLPVASGFPCIFPFRFVSLLLHTDVVWQRQSRIKTGGPIGTFAGRDSFQSGGETIEGVKWWVWRDHVAFWIEIQTVTLLYFRWLDLKNLTFFFSDGRLWWRRKLFLNLPLKQRGAERRLLGMDGQS